MASPQVDLELLSDAPDDIVLTTGQFLMVPEFERLVDVDDCPPFKAERVLRLLARGKSKVVPLPSRLKTILDQVLNEWDQQQNLKFGSDSERNSSISKRMEDILLLFRYSEAALELSKRLGGNVQQGQVSWPIACENPHKNGKYRSPPSILSTPHWDPSLLGMWDPPRSSTERSLFDIGAIVRPNLFENEFWPDQNVGVISWHDNDQEFFTNTKRNQDFDLFVRHQLFVAVDKNIFWTPDVVLQNNIAVRNVMVRNFREHASPCTSWLGPATLMNDNEKHRSQQTITFWRAPPKKKWQEDNERMGLDIIFSDDRIIQNLRYLVRKIDKNKKKFALSNHRQ